MSSLEPGAVTGPGKTQLTPQTSVIGADVEGAQPWLSESHYDESIRVRRAAAFLNSIPTNERPLVNIRWVVGKTVPAGSGYGDGQASHFEYLKARFDCVDLLGNVASFAEVDGEHSIFLPLDQIKTIWKKTTKGETIWEILLIGSLHFGNDEWQLWPPT